ncbi:hypothetical protein QTO30_01545 [Yoonia sp. GPGPB17]|uniref:hypothetical protein n=1 Tax=Yoonia sp. GPGPB17 TaxID=3026147 RepID=UPI0030C38E8C
MALEPAAVSADIALEPASGESPFTGFDPGGEWSGELVVTTYTHIKSGDAEVAWKANATFVYAGTVTATASAGTSTPVSVELTGSSDPLAGPQPVIRNGDEASDPLYGNAIVASAAGPLSSE